jgi:2-haloalkanoic acid dehalogenase type II
MNTPVLIIPGIGNSGPDHWQSLWEAADPSMVRIRAENWDRPVCASWVKAIDAQARSAGESLIVVAHSLGCLAFAHWAAQHRQKIGGALLVAVPNPSGPNFPQQAEGFAPLPLVKLPYKSILVCSQDDPYGGPEYAKLCADAWGSTVVDVGRAGHINAASDLGRWPAGFKLLNEVRSSSSTSSRGKQGKSSLSRKRVAPRVIAFDIYGTIIDTDGMAAHLENRFGARAKEAARVWREKQIEFSFRRALMRKYVNFDTCTAQALTYVSKQMDVNLDENDKLALLDSYLRLPAFPDVKSALESLTQARCRLVALTNGTEKSVRALLSHADLIQYFHSIVSVDSIQTFKPNPDVYEHLVRSVRRPKEDIWLVSSNSWDVIGAKAHGLKSVWLQRGPARMFDPWEFSPDLIVTSLEKLRHEMRQE